MLLVVLFGCSDPSGAVPIHAGGAAGTGGASEAGRGGTGGGDASTGGVGGASSDAGEWVDVNDASDAADAEVRPDAALRDAGPTLDLRFDTTISKQVLENYLS